jgi:hypothetical protein
MGDGLNELERRKEDARLGYILCRRSLRVLVVC